MLFHKAVDGIKTHHEERPNLFSGDRLIESKVEEAFNEDLTDRSRYIVDGVLYFSSKRLAAMTWDEANAAIEYTIHEKRKYYREKGFSKKY